MNKVSYFFAGFLVRAVNKLYRICERVNLYYMKRQFSHIGRNALIEIPSQFMNPQCISIGDDIIVRSGVKVRAYTTYEGQRLSPVINIGNNVHLAADVLINCTHRIDIGDNTGLGVGTKVMDHMHGFPDYSDLHIPIMKRVITSRGGVIIKDNVMVGAGVVILPVKDGKILLMHNFRHATRSWQWEIPRGFGEPGVSAEDQARAEVSEEIHAQVSELVQIPKP